MTMIECVNIGTADYFEGNPIAGALRLRHEELVKKEDWANIYVQPDPRGALEFDQYDTPATQYLVKRDEDGEVIATGRVKPTTIPYMLSHSFQDLCTDTPVSSPLVVEGSRIVINRDKIPRQDRRKIVNEILVAYMECSLHMGAKYYVAFMMPQVWRATFFRIGWKANWLGPENVIGHSGEVVRAGILPVNKNVDQLIRHSTGLLEPILDFGKNPNSQYGGVAKLSRYEDLSIYPVTKQTATPRQASQ